MSNECAKKLYRQAKVAAWLAMFLSWGNAALAQTYISPTAPPPGGRSASLLDTSGITQLKLGSLFVGQASTPKYFCLNAVSSTIGSIAQADIDAGYCINSWSSLTAGGLLPLYPDQFSVGGGSPPFPDAENYFMAANATPGYVRIRGTSSQPSLAVTADTFPGNTTSGYYGDAGSSPLNSYAAYFNGRLKVDDISGSGNENSGSLCLGSNVSNPNCIDHFSDLCATCTARLDYSDQLLFDTNNPPKMAAVHTGNVLIHNQSARLTKETGSSTAGGAWQFESAVVGGFSSTPDNKSYCGDGYCSTERGENSGADPDSCPIDCSAFPITSPTQTVVSDPGVIIR